MITMFRPAKYCMYWQNTSEARVVPNSSRVSAFVISCVVLVMFWLSTISPIREIMGRMGTLQSLQIGTLRPRHISDGILFLTSGALVLVNTSVKIYNMTAAALRALS